MVAKPPVLESLGMAFAGFTLGLISSAIATYLTMLFVNNVLSPPVTGKKALENALLIFLFFYLAVAVILVPALIYTGVGQVWGGTLFAAWVPIAMSLTLFLLAFLAEEASENLAMLADWLRENLPLGGDLIADEIDKMLIVLDKYLGKSPPATEKAKGSKASAKPPAAPAKKTPK